MTSPLHIVFVLLLESVATLNVLNIDTWNEITIYHKFELKEFKFSLSAAKNSKLPSTGTVKIDLNTDVTKKP